MFSSYTSDQGGEVFIRNSATSKVIGEKTVQFCSHDGCITTLQGIHHVSESRYNLISLGALHEEGFNFIFEGDLMKVFKDAQVKFQAERVGKIYMLQNSEVTVGGLQLFSASRLKVVEQSETTMVSNSDVQFYPKGRLGLGDTGTQQESSDYYSCVGTNSHKSCVNQRDCWVIKFRLNLNLFDLIKL